MATKDASKNRNKRPVIVTTEYRGVFFGYATDITGAIVTLTDARLCLYWSADVKGFMGLAATGPSTSCRIGPKVPRIDLRKVTAVMQVSPEAVARWEAGPWA